jgi:hypothetical protein
MTDQLITFETAVLAKNKGFCGYKSKRWFYKDGTVTRANTHRCWNTWEFTEGIRWSAPTQSFLQKWLREKSGIHIEVTPNINGFWQARLVNLGWVVSEVDTRYFQYDYPTYEEALEDALKEALKLIKDA